ncbi:Sensor kinase CckA [subsurface metagenome]
MTALEEKGVSSGAFIRITATGCRIKQNDKTGLSEGDYVHIKFEDNGIGMSNDVKIKAFDPLFTTKMCLHKGQGLGLSMVYNIITRYHNGHISIETTKGKGTIFHIYLLKSSKIECVKTLETPNVKSNNETILIIEDEEPVRNFLSEALHMNVYTTVTSCDGCDGLDTYKKMGDSIDLVLLDLTIPKMSGKEILEKIISINPNAKVIISSGHSEEELKILSHAKRYLLKPFSISTMINTIQAVLNE